MSDRHGEGMRIRREVLGDEHVAAAVAGTTADTAAFQDLITRYAWGEIWARPGLDRRTRSAITLMALIALNRETRARDAHPSGSSQRAQPGGDRRGAPPERDLLRRPGRQWSIRDLPGRHGGRGGRLMRTEPPFRADHVGSLLRPPELLRAREELAQGRLPADELRGSRRRRDSRCGADAGGGRPPVGHRR